MVPVQCVPFPKNPSSQVQVKPPAVLVQLASDEQLFKVMSPHSSTSKEKEQMQSKIKVIATTIKINI